MTSLYEMFERENKAIFRRLQEASYIQDILKIITLERYGYNHISYEKFLDLLKLFNAAARLSDEIIFVLGIGDIYFIYTADSNEMLEKELRIRRLLEAREIAEKNGLNSMIDAYEAGVPIEDIIA